MACSKDHFNTICWNKAFMKLQHWRQPSAEAERASHKGFTLIELLVVISILVLLISMILPTFRKSKEYARRTICAANSRSQVQACDAYSVDSNGFLPPSQNQTGTIFSYSFDLRSSNETPPAPMGMGIVLNQGYFDFQTSAFHCPSLDTTGATQFNTPYHSMDVETTNWWNSVGASYWYDPAHINKRITIGYTYRGPSWWRTKTYNRNLRVSATPGKTVINADILDPRFGRQFTHVQGYNYTRIDESGDWFSDPNGQLEQMALSGGVTVDGRNQPLSDEFIFFRLESGK
jgi:prepilin-type N-terminal cleavage/methylation domain-containing protein